jgi:hypothetical protein
MRVARVHLSCVYYTYPICLATYEPLAHETRALTHTTQGVSRFRSCACVRFQMRSAINMASQCPGSGGFSVYFSLSMTNGGVDGVAGETTHGASALLTDGRTQTNSECMYMFCLHAHK